MKKKHIIYLTISVIFLTVFALLNMFVLVLEKVEVNFLNDANKFSYNDFAGIIETGEFKIGSAIMFQNKSKYYINLETKNPYLKVENIETIFPNKMRINCYERTEIFSFKTTNNTYLTIDEEFKILKTNTGYPLAIEIKNFTGQISNSQNSAGTILKILSSEQSTMQQLFYALRTCQIDAMQISKMFTAIELCKGSQGKDINLTTKFENGNGVKISIERADRNLMKKVLHAISIYNKLSLEKQSKGTIFIQESVENFENLIDSYI